MHVALKGLKCEREGKRNGNYDWTRCYALREKDEKLRKHFGARISETLRRGEEEAEDLQSFEKE